ncbi:ABC transporter permease [Caloranaerobacter sp. TR13]|uniref:ABC transporter permease subunit n=1 Tax=Caloranaerobacter sp. TR13 TaxID=1302151 RepID=UPI0006D44CA2|nr:ABC transporter permease subunit [Caloranaerobacter sp. TR13]KPU26508.1 ABC transporter permease [Caloranaerobacter sp. TR13]
MNMYLHELKIHRKSTIIWTLSLIAVVLLYINLFPAFSADADVMEKILKNFPEEFKKAFGISDFDFTTLLGFYGYTFSFILLSGAIQAMNLGIGILSAEIRERTADFLLVKPITRNKIVTSKLLAAITSIAITNIFYLIAAFISVETIVSEPYNKKIFFMMSITLFFIQLIFIALGFLVSALAKKIKSVLPISLGIVFGFYIIEMFGSVIGEEKMKYITPFKYFDLAYIIENGKYEVKFIILSIVLIVVAISGSYILYSKKDIASI